jgi:hypothetical protein
MQPTTRAYEYGKRIGSDYATQSEHDTAKRVIDVLTERFEYEARLLPILREIAGYNNRNTVYPTETQYNQRDCWRDGGDKEKYFLERRIKPAFWHGLTQGFKEERTT